MWYVDAGTDDTPDPVYTHCLLLSCYPDLTFSVKLKRIAVFYNYILVLPCVLLSFLTLVIFWLPPESPAKILLGRTYFPYTL